MGKKFNSLLVKYEEDLNSMVRNIANYLSEGVTTRGRKLVPKSISVLKNQLQSGYDATPCKSASIGHLSNVAVKKQEKTVQFLLLDSGNKSPVVRGDGVPTKQPMGANEQDATPTLPPISDLAMVMLPVEPHHYPHPSPLILILTMMLMLLK
ncbi:hypothetical protein COLO4_04590 [Corchorus olitorius]|uniref:Uncharacterized protein n=1 Tax=Corchorus olitorius TaxID=93759 RepID=A0A1R3KTH9_9ROSI|nr:hypothetical protein COLO4_04590 [Corchorus olitorius]